MNFKMKVKQKSTKAQGQSLPTCKGTALQTCTTDSHQTVSALVIPKAWKYTVLVEAHDKLGHQGTT